MSDWQHIRYEQPADRVARIVLARAEMANAQDYAMLSELNEAFDRAARDDEVRVIVLAADGNHFSSGHDLRAGTDMSGIDPIGTWCCFGSEGAEGYMATEAEMYVGLCWRWRNIPKPTIAQVQGKVIAGGLMLVWPMDLVVCSDDATFADPVVAFGMNGHEYFTHPYEAGARLAKEMLFTGPSPVTLRSARTAKVDVSWIPGAASSAVAAGRLASLAFTDPTTSKFVVSGTVAPSGRSPVGDAEIAQPADDPERNVRQLARSGARIEEERDALLEAPVPAALRKETRLLRELGQVELDAHADRHRALARLARVLRHQIAGVLRREPEHSDEAEVHARAFETRIARLAVEEELRVECPTRPAESARWAEGAADEGGFLHAEIAGDAPGSPAPSQLGREVAADHAGELLEGHFENAVDERRPLAEVDARRREVDALRRAARERHVRAQREAALLGLLLDDASLEFDVQLRARGLIADVEEQILDAPRDSECVVRELDASRGHAEIELQGRGLGRRAGVARRVGTTARARDLTAGADAAVQSLLNLLEIRSSVAIPVHAEHRRFGVHRDFDLLGEDHRPERERAARAFEAEGVFLRHARRVRVAQAEATDLEATPAELEFAELGESVAAVAHGVADLPDDEFGGEDRREEEHEKDDEHDHRTDRAVDPAHRGLRTRMRRGGAVEGRRSSHRRRFASEVGVVSERR